MGQKSYSSIYTVFNGCDNINTINIGENVTKIPSYAFSGCAGITTVSIPTAVTSIGGYAFKDCSNITTVDFNAMNCASMGSSSELVFSGCTNIETINVGQNVTKIPAYAFRGCSGVTSVIIPNSVTTINSYAFEGCSDVASLTLGDHVSSIGSYAFQNCNSLKSLIIPASAESIGNNAFFGCSGLKTVVNLSSLNVVKGAKDNGYVAYYAEKVINNPDNIDGFLFENGELVEYIGNQTMLTLPASLNEGTYSIAENAFKGNVAITSVSIPECVTGIGPQAFMGCSKLKQVYNNGTMTQLSQSAFKGCSSLEEVTIPATVSNIGQEAFSGCSALTNIECNNASVAPACEADVFETSIYETCELAVPAEAQLRYYALTPWANFQHIVARQDVEYTLTLNNERILLNIGETFELIPSYSPEKQNAPIVIFSSSNNDVATVDSDGIISAVEEGTATITVTEVSGLIATCEVTVADPAAPVDYSFAISDGTLRKGETNIVAIGLENVGDALVAQFDVEIPEGVTLGVDNYGDVDVSIAGRCDNTHVLTSSMVNGRLRVLLYSSKNHPFSGNEGALVNIPVNVNDDVEAGEILTFKVVNGLITLGGSLVEVASPICEAEYEVTAYTPGDINNDGKITGADIAFCVELIMEHNPANAIAAAADINGDGKVTGADIAAIIELILDGSQNAPAYAAPSHSRNNCENCLNASLTNPSTVALSLNNVDNCVAMQFDVLVPEGVTIDNVASCHNNSSLSLAYRNLGNGVYRVIAYSPNNRIADKNATVAILGFNGNSIEDVEICNILLTTKTPDTISETAYAPINFGNEVTGLYSIASGEIKVWAENGSIVVETDKEVKVVVTDLAGRSSSLIIGAGRTHIPVPVGIYLVNNSKLIVK